MKRTSELLAELEPDAMDVVDKIRDSVIQEPCEGVQQIGFILTDSKAAALIESRRVVPRAMLEEVWEMSVGNEKPSDGFFDAIATKHGYKVED